VPRPVPPPQGAHHLDTGATAVKWPILSKAAQRAPIEFACLLVGLAAMPDLDLVGHLFSSAISEKSGQAHKSGTLDSASVDLV